ncbi:MAG TPA: recombination protein O N-terminal domain-containing protein [Novosphingobium sp.]|nr:recombination protein O N-terminal domain-containing protein [Novosphingobium sp.]
MQFNLAPSEPGIVCAVVPHGETAVIARLLTREAGLVGAYVAGGRGRQLRPVLMPGNLVAGEVRARAEGQLPFARLELVTSRGPWLGEPLPAAAIGWATALAATALPELQPYPDLHAALRALLDAVCAAPSARGWLPALVGYEALTLRELGYGAPDRLPDPADAAAQLALLDRLGPRLARYALAHRQSDVMAARAILRERLGKIG